MINKKNIVAIPEGALYLNGIIYIPMNDENYKEISINSFIYNKRIYVPFNKGIESMDIKKDHVNDLKKININKSKTNFEKEENIMNSNIIQNILKKQNKTFDSNQKNCKLNNININI